VLGFRRFSHVVFAGPRGTSNGLWFLRALAFDRCVRPRPELLRNAVAEIFGRCGATDRVTLLGFGGVAASLREVEGPWPRRLSSPALLALHAREDRWPPLAKQNDLVGVRCSAFHAGRPNRHSRNGDADDVFARPAACEHNLDFLGRNVTLDDHVLYFSDMTP